jgi:hypothetical protein
MCSKNQENTNIQHRGIFSHMVVSHIAIIIPCIWWIFGSNSGTYASHCIDKIMAIILTMSVMITMTYHYYYECVFHSIEANALIINTLALNMYMLYRGVHYLYILYGVGILYILQLLINRVEKEKCIVNYELYHPFCHYLVGVYVTYCVYLIQFTFTNQDICPTDVNSIDNVLI